MWGKEGGKGSRHAQKVGQERWKHHGVTSNTSQCLPGREPLLLTSLRQLITAVEEVTVDLALVCYSAAIKVMLQFSSEII